MGHGSRGGCLVSQGACVRHSVDETGAGGQCWRPKEQQRCLVTSVESPHTRDGAGLDQGGMAATTGSCLIQEARVSEEKPSTLLMG